MDNNEQDYVDCDIDDYGLCGGGDDICDDEETKRYWEEYTNALREQAEQGDADAQFKLGECYSCDYNIAEAEKWYRRAAEQGHAGAQRELGFLYGFGWFIKKDEVEGAKWYRKAAEQGDRDAQLNLGRFYQFGCGVNKDKAEAEKWFHKAIEQGSGLAKLALKELKSRP